ncbi:MAG: single-stranded-DNA-specific exonuclease RecJ [Lachnospiraceae bacterium]|nr:single-stranded-DNA-specific exonuclease RecJ [Lachnospiraceae bacterium]
MAQWRLIRNGADYEALSKKYGLDPVLLRIMRNRGITEDEQIEEYLNGDMAVCDCTDGFIDMDCAITHLKSLKGTGRKIRIIGDYDIDGVCSTAILYKGLQAYGLSADYAIPHRVLDGYGINVNLVEKAGMDGVDTILTCDNGITAYEALQRAAELGITVIVTDHHDIRKETVDGMETEKLPKALALINPKREGNKYAFSEICGAYVAYKLVSKMLNLSNETDKLHEELLVLAAFATIGDVMPLIKENRILVQYGLSRIKECANVGLQALINKTGLREKEIKAYSIGFILGPCLNAKGRLESAERSLELLLCGDEEAADKMAMELVQTNEERKKLTEQSVEHAVKTVREQYAEDKIIVLYLEDCHESIAGIVAGRVREAFYRPVWVLTDAQEGLKGSGRSIDAYDMHKGLCECEALLTHFGGHKLAAGVSLPKDNLDAFRLALNENAMLTEEDLTEIIRIDVDLPFGYSDEKFIKELERLEPFGKGNEKPVFAQAQITFVKGRIFGARNNVASFRVKDNAGRFFELKYFGDIPAFNRYLDAKFGEQSAARLYAGEGNYKISVIYYPDLNTYNGRTEVQLILKDYS